jgi:tRNA pseudouridine38-40 synthase
MFKRYFIELSFDGSHYHGWQMQENAESVQAVITNALNCILGIDTEITGAGRTDTGVHARNYIAHFDIGQKKLKYPPEKLLFKLNSFLPPDIVIHNIYEVRPDVHARFSAVSRTYRYYISRTKDPFSSEFASYIYGALDIKKMNQAAKILLKTSDFMAFSKSGSDNKSTICNVTQAFWEEKDNMIVFTITANRFLRNMVRAIVGTLTEVGKEKITLDGFKKIIESKNRSDAGTSVPACGLFLEKIDYPGDIRKGIGV